MRRTKEVLQAIDKVPEEKIRDKEWEPSLVVVMVVNLEPEEIKDKEIKGNK